MFGFVRFVATNLSIKRNDAGETSPWVSSVSEAHPANPLVSVVIPAFNRERVIGKAIKSVLAHWLRRFRILKSLLLTMGRQHAVNTAAALFRRSDRRRRSSGRPFVCDDLLEALDTVLGEGRDAILADAVDAQAAVFGEHVDREFV